MMATFNVFTSTQKQVGTTLHKSQYRIDQRIKKWQDLRQSVESVKVRPQYVSLKPQHESKSKTLMFSGLECNWICNLFFSPLSYVYIQHSAQTVQEENERIFSELLLSIERKYNEVKEMIRSHEKITVTRGEILLDRMEEEITLLRKRHHNLEKLSHTDDHIHFLQVKLINAEIVCCAEDMRQKRAEAIHSLSDLSYLYPHFKFFIFFFTRAGSLCLAPLGTKT